MATRAAFLSRRRVTGTLLVIGLVSGCNEEPRTAPVEIPSLAPASASPTVAATDPSSAPQDTTLDVRVLGSGFDKGSKAEFALNGVVGPTVKTNRTTYRTTKELIANITIAADASPEKYDVIVTTSTGKKGIGTERFEVLAMEELAAPTGTSIAYAVNGTGLMVGFVTGAPCGNGRLPTVWRDPSSRINLPLPPGGCDGIAADVNTNGVIVGTVTGKGVRWLPDGAGGWTAALLGPAPDGLIPQVTALNDAGSILGAATSVDNATRAYIWSETSGWRALHTDPTLACYPTSISLTEGIAGDCSQPSGIGGRAVAWPDTSSTPTFLPLPAGASTSSAADINAGGIIAGTVRYGSGHTLVRRAVRWVPAAGAYTLEFLGDLGGGQANALAINDAGQIVGRSNYNDTNEHAFLWTPGAGMRDLGALGSQRSYGYGVNTPPALGGGLLVVGTSQSSSVTRAVVWRP